MRVLLDTGPWVALLIRNDSFHHWARDQFATLPAPLYSCDAVLTETCFLLSRGGFDPGAALRMVEQGAVRIDFNLADEIANVRTLFERYDNVPASLADACLIRMSELHEPSKVLTLDTDFRIYRRNSRRIVPVIAPDSRA